MEVLKRLISKLGRKRVGEGYKPTEWGPPPRGYGGLPSRRSRPMRRPRPSKEAETIPLSRFDLTPGETRLQRGHFQTYALWVRKLAPSQLEREKTKLQEQIDSLKSKPYLTGAERLVLAAAQHQLQILREEERSREEE
ncbi:MAG: hypothetical protein DRO11_00980 [Methanobacteriota archaeon]|nr:MAG: hypothetical protein DRO11_00980 [Euryarchaeota archaeon]